MVRMIVLASNVLVNPKPYISLPTFWASLQFTGLLWTCAEDDQFKEEKAIILKEISMLKSSSTMPAVQPAGDAAHA